MKRSQTTDEGANDSRDKKTRVATPLEPAERQLLEEFVIRHGQRLTAHAAHCLLRLHVAGAEYNAQEAVADAILKLWGGADRRQLAAVEDDVLLRFLLATLTCVIRDARKRSGRIKRGGKGAHCQNHEGAPRDPAGDVAEHAPHPWQRRDIVLEQICSAGPAFDPDVIEEDRFQVLLDHLDDPVLRKIAGMRRQSYTQEEIAGELELGRNAIQGKLAIIQRVFLKLNVDPGGARC